MVEYRRMFCGGLSTKKILQEEPITKLLVYDKKRMYPVRRPLPSFSTSGDHLSFSSTLSCVTVH